MSRVLKNYENQVTQHFGVNGHLGMDIVGKGGKIDEIIAHEDGIVIMCQKGRKNNVNSIGNESYGNFIKIKHDNYFTLYAHLDEVYVNLNDKVKKGQVIGKMGNTGKSYGAHLHFEVFNKYNIRLNPINFIDGEYPDENKFDVGRYEVKVDTWLNVREKPTIESKAKTYNELTVNARNQNGSLGNCECNGLLNGVICDVFEVSGDWGKIPSGWINLNYCNRIH